MWSIPNSSYSEWRNFLLNPQKIYVTRFYQSGDDHSGVGLGGFINISIGCTDSQKVGFTHRRSFAVWSGKITVIGVSRVSFEDIAAIISAFGWDGGMVGKLQFTILVNRQITGRRVQRPGNSGSTRIVGKLDKPTGKEEFVGSDCRSGDAAFGINITIVGTI